MEGGDGRYSSRSKIVGLNVSVRDGPIGREDTFNRGTPVVP